MKGRILPLGDLAEYGKAESAALLISMSPTEAQQIIDALNEETVRDYEQADKERSLPVRLLEGYLAVIAGSESVTTEEAQDAVNTEGRSLRRRESSNAIMASPLGPGPIQITMPGTAGPPAQINPLAVARRVAEEMGTHGQRCNCEYHRLARGGR